MAPTLQPSVKLMNWILKNKGGCTHPIPLGTLFTESPFGVAVNKDCFKNGVRAKLERADRMKEYGLNDRVKLLFILSQPVNETFEKMLRDDGATLELTDGRVISYFRSADGTVERGVPTRPAQPEAAEPVQEEVVEQPEVKIEAAGLVAPKVEEVDPPIAPQALAKPVPAQHQVEPKQEAPEAPILQGAPAERAPVRGAVEPKQEVPIPAQQAAAPNQAEPKQEAAKQTPAPSQVEHQNRKRKTAGPSPVNSEATEPVTPKIQKVGLKQVPELTVGATAVLENLCSLCSAFDWSDEIGLNAQDEMPGRSDQRILRNKIQKVVDNTFEMLMDNASSKIPASEDSIKFVHFLRVYRTWLRTTKYNNVQDIDHNLGEEIRAYDLRENGTPVKRILINKLLFVLGMWLNVATPPI